MDGAYAIAMGGEKKFCRRQGRFNQMLAWLLAAIFFPDGFHKPAMRLLLLLKQQRAITVGRVPIQAGRTLARPGIHP
jgi:hypothetical protein